MAITKTNAKAGASAIKQMIKKGLLAEDKLEGGDPKVLANIRAAWQRATIALNALAIPDEPEPEPEPEEVVADEAEDSGAD